MTAEGPLTGILVADFSRILAGPYVTMLLGDLGAEVVKVERRGVGDDVRGWGPPWDGEGRSTNFESVNRNKRSLALDLTDPDDQRSAYALALRADVLVENFAPGTMERFGLGYEQLREANPRLVYASITGFGRGAGAGRPGYDLMVQAVGGLMSITGPAAGQPTRTGVAMVDVVTGLHCGMGILAALHDRGSTGEGQRVDVALLSSLLSALVNQAGAYAQVRDVPGIIGNTHPSIAPYQTYDTADRPLVVAVGNDAQFRAFCAAIGRLDLAVDERFTRNGDRVTHRDELNAVVAPVMRGRGADEWEGILNTSGVPCGPVNDLAEAFALADRLGLEPVVDVARADGSVSHQVAPPIRLSRTPGSVRSAPPGLGDIVVTA